MSDCPEFVICAGFKVPASMITKCPPYVPPRVPLPVPARFMQTARRPEPKRPETVTISLPLLDQSEAYVAVEHNGAKVWVGRSKAFSLALDAGTVTIEVEANYARKRGFI